MNDRSAARRWLLLVYRVPSQPSRTRTYIWRQLKALGALGLQQAGWVLPWTEEYERGLEQLAAKIEGFGGEATLFTTQSPSREWEERLIAGFNRARDEEYAEVIENAERFEDEIRRETRKEKFTFAELEEAEGERERLHRWYERVRARDHYSAPLAAEAQARLAEGERLLREFTRRVYERQGVCEGPDLMGEGQEQ